MVTLDREFYAFRLLLFLIFLLGLVSKTAWEFYGSGGLGKASSCTICLFFSSFPSAFASLCYHGYGTVGTGFLLPGGGARA